MTKTRIACGQVTIQTLQESYTITQTIANYVFTSDDNGLIPDAVSLTSSIKVAVGNAGFFGFMIGNIVKPPGFSAITVNNTEKTITFSVKANTSDLADSGSVIIPVIIAGLTYNLSFVWSKSKRGQSGTNGADGYTVKSSRLGYVISTDKDGRIHTAVTTSTAISACKGMTGIIPVIGILPSVPGCLISKVGTTVTIVFQAGAALAENGVIDIPVTVDSLPFMVSFSYAKARTGVSGETGAAGADANMLDWVKDWNSNKTMIGVDSVITPKLFTGIKNSNGTLTGIAMGHFTLNTLNASGSVTAEMIDGLYGFRQGYRTFCIDNSGNVELGRGNQVIRYNAVTGRIEFGLGVSLNWVDAINTVKTDLVSDIADAKKTGTDARSVADAITDKANSEGWATKLTFIGSTGIFTGTLSSNTVNSIRINASQITAGTINAAHIDTVSLKATLLTAGNIEALTLNVTRGRIGGWNIGTDSIFRGAQSNISGGYTSSSGSITIGSNGIRSFKWRLDGNGAGALAGGNIEWDARGNITFGPSVVLNWTNAAADALDSAKSYADTKKAEAVATAATDATDKVNVLGEATLPKLTKITATGIYTGTVEATQIRANSITAGQINVSSIQSAVVTAAIVNGLSCTFVRGSIGGFVMTENRIYDTDKHIVLQSGGSRRIGICKAADAVLTGGTACVMLFYNSDNDWGLYGHDGTNHVFSLGSICRIAGWNFDDSHIWKNNVSLGADGSIVNSTRWKLNNDGSGQLANGAITWTAAGMVTFSSSVSLNWTNAATTALNSAKSYADTKKSEAISSAASDATAKADAAKELASAMAFGKMLYRDPTFFKGDNGTNVYNNKYNGTVVITHETDNNAPNDSKRVLVIKNMGLSEPHCGGFYFGTMASYRKIFITRIIAKIPIGRNISFHSNSMGTGGTQKWLTPVAGIGEWCVYICKVKCGTANFASTHFFTVTGSVGTTSSPVEWRVAYATVFDVTSTEKYPTTIDGDGIYTASLNAGQITAGTISADRIAAGSIHSSKLDAGSIRADIINVSYINGLTCNFVRGTIGGFLITADSIHTHPIGSVGALPIQIRSGSSGSGYWYNGSYKPKGVTLTWHQSENAGHIILGEIAVNGSTVRTGYMGIQMMAWDGTEYFCLSANCTRSGSKEVYNRIAGWAFDHTHIWKNSVSLGSDGSIYNGDKWRLNNDGSGKIANGNIVWDTSGAVTFSSSVSLNWKNDIEAAKSTNYGYRYATTIVINGESNKYYPVVVKGGDQMVKRDILINRAFYEQAPGDWANSTTHMGGLNLHIKANFGGWGGAGYSWNIQELEEEYSRMFAGAIICGCSCMFAVFLRGGGATGAVYHVYSNQSLTERPFNEPPVSEQAPQICYNSDLIFKSPNSNGGYYLASAPAPRTLTSDVETEIKAHRYAASTHIDSNGIYTGTLTAGQITAGTISTDRLDAASIRTDIVNSSYINGLTCAFVRGSIGGWNLDSGNIFASTPNNGHRVYIRSNGYLFNDDGSTDYWALKPDGSAVFGYGKIQFYNDGSGYLANRNITWDVSGNVTMTGTINANAGSIGGFTIASGRIGSTASGSGSGGGLAIYNDLFRVGSSISYVLFGDNTFPASSGGTSAAGRIVNTRYSSYNTNYGLYIDVRNGDKNLGIYSNAPCLANAFIGNKITNIYFSGSSYTWDFSKNNVFFVYANRFYNVNLPSSSSVAYMFGFSSLPSDFGYMFTVIYNYNWGNQLTFMNVRDQNGNLINIAMQKGDTLTLLCANYPSFHYQVVHRQN